MFCRKRTLEFAMMAVATAALIGLLWPNPSVTQAQSTNSTVEISLVPGWNLVSLPLIPSNPNLPAVLASIEGSYDQVMAYDSTNSAAPWQRYLTGTPPYVNTLTTLDEKRGFWLHMTTADTLLVEGTAPTSTAIPLQAGWNLIGYPSAQARPIAEALASQAGHYTLVYGYRANDLADLWKLYDAGASPLDNDLTQMEQGRGYWVYASQVGTLTVPASTVNKCGTISVDQTWTTGTVYNLTCDVTVNAGAKLTIQPGVVVKVGPSYGLIINGILDAQGVPGSRITFTSNKTAPAAGDWDGIWFTSTSGGSILDYAVVEYAGNTSTTYDSAIYVDLAPITVTSSTVVNSAGFGVRVSGAPLSLTESTIAHTSSSAIYLSDSTGTWLRGNTIIGRLSVSHGSPNIDGNSFISNSSYPISANGATLTVTNNSFTGTAGYPFLYVGASDVDGLNASGNTVSGSIQNAIAVNGGELTGNHAWHYFQVPYKILGSITVAQGATLTLDAGATLLFEPEPGASYPRRLDVQGNLVTQGTADAPVTFTRQGDTGKWTGICIDTTSTSSILNHAMISYAGGDAYPCSSYSGTHKAHLVIRSSSATVSSSTLDHGLYGIWTTASATIRDSVFEDFQWSAIVALAGSPIIDGNSFTSDSNCAISTNGATPTITDNAFTGAYDAPFLYVRVGDVHGLNVSGNTVSGSIQNAIAVNGGELTGNHAWHYFQVPYKILGSITVAQGATLTLDAGATLLFEPEPGASYPRRLDVQGNLVTHGTADAPVTFTRQGDTGKWTGICIDTTSTNSILDHATISYAGGSAHPCSSYYGSFSANIAIHSSSTSVSNTSLSNSVYGIRVIGASPTLTSNTITQNSIGIGTSNNAAPVMNANTIAGNYSAGLANFDTSTEVDASDTWWGDESGPYHASLNPGGWGNPISGSVIFSPWIGQGVYYAHNTAASSYWSAFAAEPVNTIAGNYLYQHTDLSVPSRGLPTTFDRHYNSASTEDGPLGYGWTHSYNLTATLFMDDSVVIRNEDGRLDRFASNGDDTYESPSGEFSHLIRNPDGSYTLTRKNRSVLSFSASGLLVSLADRNDNVLTFDYDNSGNLAGIFDTVGRAFTFSYDMDGHLTSLIDPVGRGITYTYNISGELAAVTDVRDQTTTYTYDASHRLVSITDANGHTFVHNTYDSEGRVIEQRDALNYLTTFSYDTTNRRTTVTDPLSHATVYYYDAHYRLTREQDPLGYSITYAYDDHNNRTAVTDKRGNTTHFSYDARRNVIAKTDPLSYTLTYTYDGQDNLTTETDALGYTTVYTYDLSSNLIARRDPLKYLTTWTHDAHGQMLAASDACGHTAHYSYDAFGNQAVITDALGFATAYTYDLVGRQLSKTDALGRVVTYTYDAADHVLTIAEPLGKLTAYTYDNAGNCTSVTDPRGGVTISVFDEKDRLSRTTDPLGHTTHHFYDAANNEISVIDPLSHTIKYGYDALARRTSVTDSLNHTTTHQYDPNGNRTYLIDANGNITQYGYDALNRLTSVADALSGTLCYAYDGNSNRVSMTDANKHTTTYSHDALNRLVTTTNPLDHEVSNGYDAVGNCIRQTKADGMILTYSYDALNRMVGISGPGISISYAYDPIGNRTAMTDSLGITLYHYDDLSRMIKIESPGSTVAYGYDLSDNRTHLTYPSGQVVTYTYDLADRMTGVTDWAGRVFTYTYDAVGRQNTLSYPNGTLATYAYDPANRLLGISHLSPVSATLAMFTYTLDAVGNRLTEQDLDGTTSYTYDDLYRLTQVTYPNSETVQYSYDAMSNRTAMTNTVSGVITYTYDVGDKLLTAGPLAFSWDPNGNMTGKGSATYTFDSLDRLVQVYSGTMTVQMNYNGDGARMRKAVNGATTEYVQDLASSLAMVLAEATESPTSLYIFGDDLLARVDPEGDLLFYHTDGLGSTRALSNAAGQRTDVYRYDVFGSLLSHVGSEGQPFTFAGEQMDSEINLLYLRARYMDPQVGRFTTIDPFPGFVEDVQSLHPYSYAQNNPINYTDPSGKAVNTNKTAWDVAVYGNNWWNTTAGAVTVVAKKVATAADAWLEFGQNVKTLEENWAGYYDVQDPEWNAKYRTYSPGRDFVVTYRSGAYAAMKTPGTLTGGRIPQSLSGYTVAGYYVNRALVPDLAKPAGNFVRPISSRSVCRAWWGLFCLSDWTGGGGGWGSNPSSGK